VPLSEESLVVDIGSHEKMLLRSFKDKARILGIDPDPGIARQAYFTSELAESVRKEKGYASVVIANYIFANIDDLDDVATGIRSLLAPDGIFVLETSYLLDVLEKALLDTIFHEHVSYFAVKPLESFFQRHGLKLFDVERVSMKGGSIRCFFQLAGGPFKRNGSVSKMIEGESKACIYNKEAFRRLSDKLEDLRVQLNEMLDSLTEQKKTVACYGTAVGITTMLYYFGIAEKISFIIDDNPAKQNTSSPGFHLPVFSSEAIYEKKPDYIFVGAWRYFEKIKTKHVEYLDRGGHFILPLPQLEII